MPLFLEPEEVDDGVPGPPGLPLGQRVHLPGRGTTFYREMAGPPGAPTVLLLHGWIASSGLNWFQVYGPLSKHFRVIAIDHRGHGRGIRSARRFRLADCADDAAALCEHLGIRSVIAVGYSMGGPIAQLLWYRHRDLVDGLVLAATAQKVVPGVHQQLIFTTMMTAAASTTRLSQIATKLPRSLVKSIIPDRVVERPGELREWASAEMRRHSYRMILEAGNSIGNYSARKWIGEIDVPTVVLVTTRDRALPPIIQVQMALNIPDAEIHRINDGHLACASPDFAEPVVNACLNVAGNTHQLKLVS